MAEYDNAFLETTKTTLRIGNIITFPNTLKDNWGKVLVAKGNYKIMSGHLTWVWGARLQHELTPEYGRTTLRYSKYTNAGKIYPNHKDSSLKRLDEWIDEGLCIIKDDTTYLTTAGKVTSKSKHPDMGQWKEVFSAFGMKDKISFPNSTMQKILVRQGTISVNGRDIKAPSEVSFYTVVDNRTKIFTDIIIALADREVLPQDVEDTLSLVLIK